MCGLAIRVARGLPDTATKRKSRKLATSRVASPASDLRIRYPAIWRASAGAVGGYRSARPAVAGRAETAWTDTTYYPDFASASLQAPGLGVPGEPVVAGVRQDVAVGAAPRVQLGLLEQRQGRHVLPEERVHLVVEARRLRRVKRRRRLVEQRVHLRVGVVVPVRAAQVGVRVRAVDGDVAGRERRGHPGELDDVELALRTDGAEQRVGRVVLDVDLDADVLHVGLEELLDLGPHRLAGRG